MQTAVKKAVGIGRATMLAIGVGVSLALVLGVATVALAAVLGGHARQRENQAMNVSTETRRERRR